MSRSFFAHCSTAVEPLRIVDGGGMVVTVTRVDGEAVELGNGSEWIVGRNPHQLAKSVINRGEVFEAALALNGFEKVIDGDVQSSEIAVVLEEPSAARQPGAPAARRVSAAKQLTTGARAAQTAKDSGGKIVLIGDAMAEVAGLGSREGFKGGLEQTVKNG